jgi:hypothetical protein
MRTSACSGVRSTEDLSDLISIDPVDSPVIDIGELEHRVHPGVSGSSLTEDNLSHPPVVYFLIAKGGRIERNDGESVFISEILETPPPP